MKKGLFVLPSLLLLVLSACGPEPASSSLIQPSTEPSSEPSSPSATDQPYPISSDAYSVPDTSSSSSPATTPSSDTSTVPPVSTTTQTIPPIPSSSTSGGDVYSNSSASSASGSTITVDFNDAKWPGLSWDLFGESFRAALASCSAINGNTTSYSSCLSVGAQAAAYPNANSNTFIPFYHDHTMDDLATTGQCNREHTWPDSRGGNLIETDPLVIRPTLNVDNSSRGNNFYGNEKSNEWDPGHYSCKIDGTTVWRDYPGARGESARIILYAATRYKNKGLTLSNNPNDNKTLKTMGTLKTLLKWNREYAPSDFEKTVNNRYENMGYARNPFVDHPEYADFIWDDNGFRTSAYDGGAYVPPVVSSTSSTSAAYSSTSSSSSSAAPVTAIEITNADFSSSSPTTETASTMGGVDFMVCNVGNFENSIQMKSGLGYLYNTSALEEQTTLVITVAAKSSADPIVYLGTSQNPSNPVTVTKDGSTMTFDITDAPYFKIKAGTGVTRLSSIRIA